MLVLLVFHFVILCYAFTILVAWWNHKIYQSIFPVLIFMLLSLPLSKFHIPD